MSLFKKIINFIKCGHKKINTFDESIYNWNCSTLSAINKEVFETTLPITEEDEQFEIEIEHEILKLNKNDYE
ncbi:17250_t:CDS:1, partial [Cetraspora pellucida]